MIYRKYFNTDLQIGEATIAASIGEQVVLTRHIRPMPEGPTDWTVGPGSTVADISQAAYALLRYFEEADQ